MDLDYKASSEVKRHEDGLYQVVLYYLCAGFELKDEVVIEAAPIIRWMIGKTYDELAIWVYRKNGTINYISLRT